MRASIFALALFALPLAAQTPRPAPEDSLRLSDLEAEIRATNAPGVVYFRQLDEAWDRAIVARQFGRADSVAVLAETYLVETQGLVRDSVVWPSIADRFALGLLAGDLWAIRWLADGGAWWDTPTASPYPRSDLFYVETMSRLTLLPGPRYDLRLSTRNTLASDSSAVPERLAARGATPEEADLARLAVRKLLLPLPGWYGGPRDMRLTDKQEALNRGADAFLERYPDTPYGRWVREDVRLRFRADGSAGLYFGLGAGAGGGNLGEATGASIAGEIGFALRYRWWHGALSIHGGDLAISETRVGTGGTDIVETDRLSVGLLGLEVGPRLALGSVDVLPHVAGGIVLQGISAQDTDEPELSTYSPTARPSWGYGLALEYLGSRERRYGGTALRLRVSRIYPQLERGFEDILAGPVTSVSVGLSVLGMIRSRVD